MNTLELAAYCFTPAQQLPHQEATVVAAMRARCLEWMQAARYRAFIENQRDKIRGKIRRASDDESLRDLWVELAVAERLLRDRRIALEYEHYAAAKQRGPDFTASYTTKFRFNVEVRRMRSLPTLVRWLDVLCDKLGQMPASSINVLYVATALPVADGPASFGEDSTSFNLAATMTQIRLAAERREDQIFQRCRLGAEGRVAAGRAYLQSLHRLSAVVLWQGWDTASDEQVSLWKNDQAKFPIPQEALSSLLGKKPAQ